ncbi:MAG TPA: hypothetical protein P5514_02885 [Bacteroidales bacterium]|nr:hypothetical protein [Bacteroidales bacterium]HPE56815.1 hypothetical protein [Bacteroidales bacterium]HRX95867.1 hypothetical protein [Bacteroidales bacterium]
MITSIDFQNLTEDLKSYVLLNNGQHVAERGYGIYSIQLYAVYGFFVEVYYLPGSDEIDQIVAVNSSEVLELYLDSIDITDAYI